MTTSEPITDRVEGNDQVVSLLTKWLDFAKQGDMRFAAVVGCRTSDDVITDCAGAQGTEFAAYFGLDEMKQILSQSLKNRSIPIQTEASDKSCWLYSVAQWTVGYDFFQWLLNVAVVHNREKNPDPLKIYFYAGKDNNWDNALNNPLRKQMYDKVCNPMVPLLGAEFATEANGRYLDHTKAFTYIPVIDAYNDGIELPKFKAPDWAKQQIKEKFGDRHPIVITLRETNMHMYRNSNIPEWLKFAEWLKDQGEDVLFLRDTEKADEPMEGWETYSEASKELELRMAVYEIAKLTYFGSNGPFALVTVSDIPWICVYPLDDSKSYKYNNPDVWTKTMGIKPGENWPWCRPDQKFFLKHDTFENLVESWNSLGDQCIED